MRAINRTGGGSIKINVNVAPYAKGAMVTYADPSTVITPAKAAQFSLSKGVMIVPTSYTDVSFISKLNATGDVIPQFSRLSSNRSQVTLAPLGDDSIIAAGGGNSAIADRIYSDGTRTSAPNLQAAVNNARGIMLKNGSGIIACGTMPNSNVRPYFDIYNVDGTRTTGSYSISITGSEPNIVEMGDSSLLWIGSQSVYRAPPTGTGTVVGTFGGGWWTNVGASFKDGSVVFFPHRFSPTYNYYVSRYTVDGVLNMNFLPVDSYIGQAVFAAPFGSDVIFVAKQVDPPYTVRVYLVTPDARIVQLQPFPLSNRDPAYYSTINGDELLCGPNSGTYLFDIFVSGRTKSILIPASTEYRFQEHANVQPSFSKDTHVILEAPNTGYFQPEKGSITK